MAVLKFVALSGSFRKASTNLGLLRAAAEIAKEHFPDVEIEILRIDHLPFVNTDLEVNNTFPEDVTQLRAKVQAADGVIFATAEYNYSLPAVLKNAIDWASRPPNQWADKPAAILSSGGGWGGGRSSYHLRQVGVYIDLHFINKPEVFVQAFAPPIKFDQNGDVIDNGVKEQIKNLIQALRDWTLRIKRS